MTSFYGGGAASTSGGGGSSAKGALIFKGTLGISDDGATVLALPDTHEEGWTYLVVTAGTYAGQLCEKGDFVICVSSGESASDLDWTVVQGNTFSTLPTPTALDEGKIITVGADGNYTLIDNSADSKLDKNNGTATGTTTFDKAQANRLELLVDGESIGGFRSIDLTPAVTDNGDDSSMRFVPLFIGEPTKDAHAATKKYVDDKAGNYLPLAGGTMNGSINAGENTVTNLKEPENGTDATTKNYVDGEVAKATPVSIMPIPEVEGQNLIIVNDSVEWPLQGFKIYGKSTQDGTPSLENPQPIVSAGDGGSIGLTVTTSNLLHLPTEDYERAGISVKITNGISIVSGTAIASGDIKIFNQTILAAGKYYFHARGNANIRIFLNGMLKFNSLNFDFALECASGDVIQYSIYVTQGTTYNNDQVKVWLSLSQNDEFEPYVSQSLSLSTPNGLPGIPVDSGGNYTDAEGQQLVCNYKDYAREVYVQRCALEKIVGTPNFKASSEYPERYLWANALTNIYANGGTKSLSTFGKWVSWGMGNEIGIALSGSSIYFNYLKSDAADEVNALFSNLIETNQCYILGQLANPIETPLSEEEIAAYRALHTYDGTTVVSTNEDIAGLKVKYVAKAIDYQQSINAAIQETNDKIDAVYNSLVKKAETVDEVNKLFKDWWNANWEDDSSIYNDMLERWFGKVLNDDKVYGVKLPLFETSTSPQGEYIEDSVGAIVTPATEEDPGQNDFAKTPQFWCVEVAAEKNADGSHTIYACEYIDDINVVRNGGPDNGKHLVWVLQKNTYVREYEESGYSYIKIQCHPAEGFVQWPQGTDRTGHTYSYMANPKYAAGVDDEGNIGGRTGLKPTSYMSMNQTIQAWRARGPQYSGSSACFYKWAYIMFALLTAKKGEDVGCNNYNLQYAAAVSESGVSRIILTADQANNLYVGSNVIIGNTEGNNDRGQAAMYSLVNQKRISSIEEVTIEEDASSYKAVYIDVPEGTTFNTTAGTTYISTMPYYSGWTDTVKGTIGTRYGTNLNKQPYLLQKVELMNGAYNYASDELDEWSQQDDTHYLYSYYLCEDQTKVSTNGTITDDYVKKENATITIDTSVYTTNNSWYYIEDNLTDNNFKMLNPKKISTSAGSGTGTRDAFYLSYAASDVRAPMVWASLWDGGFAGLSCRLSRWGPSWPRWLYVGGCPGLSG